MLISVHVVEFGQAADCTKRIHTLNITLMPASEGTLAYPSRSLRQLRGASTEPSSDHRPSPWWVMLVWRTAPLIGLRYQRHLNATVVANIRIQGIA